MKKVFTIMVAAVMVAGLSLAVISVDAQACNKSAKAETETASAKKSCSSKDAVAGYSKTKNASSCAKSAEVASGSCCASKNAVAGYEKAGDCDKVKAQNAELAEVVDELPYAESKRVVVVGVIQCGSCSYEATNSCAPLVKTSDGKVYPLVSNQKVKDLRGEKPEEVEISARVKNLHGVKYLDVTAYKVL